LVAGALHEQFGVVARQHPQGASEPHKGHGHLGCFPTVLGRSHLVDRTRRKAQGKLGVETYHLLSRASISANGLAVRVEALEHTYGLKEIKPVSFFEETVLYRRICSPALGGHRFKGSSRCWVVAIS